MSGNRKSSRRTFLSQSAVAAGGMLATPYFFSSASARAAEAAAADKVTIGCIGVGSRGTDILHQTIPHANIVAVCDVDARHAAAAQQAANGAGNHAEIYDDYRAVLDRKDIQAVTVVTPDHWHVKIAIEALQAGKDVYCEKPLTLTIDEGKLICEAVKKYGKVFQVGTQQRTEFNRQFLTAVALVREGRLGKVSRVQCAIGAPPSSSPIPVVAPNPALNWERWQGQTPLVDYRETTEKKDDKGNITQWYNSRCHYEFRWWYEYSGGKLTDWGAHHVDIALWALQLDKTGPSLMKVNSSKHPVPFKDGYPTLDDRYNTAVEFNLTATYPGVELTIRHDTDNGILFEGDKGRIFVNRERLSGKPVEELKDNPLPEATIRNIYKGKEPTTHMANFFDCVKSREEPISDVFSHHRAISTCHLANIALRLDREVKWDPETQQVIGDDQANSFLKRTQRKGYEIVV